jgi:hypothetical protein
MGQRYRQRERKKDTEEEIEGKREEETVKSKAQRVGS